jgi:hypothetical protein
MTINAAKVLVGTADQQNTTGAIRSGDLVEEAPANFTAADTAAAALEGSGYVSEDGIELSTDLSTNDIREWNHATVRKVLDTFDGTITFSLIQQDYESWCQAVGEENVTQVAATTTHGEQLRIALGAHLAPERSWAFMMKDGDTRVIIFIPRGQITAMDAITFSATDAVAIPLTLSAYDDGSGESIYIFIDDGKKTSGN